MKFNIVTYNCKMVKFGIIASYIGLVTLLLNIIPKVWESYGMIVVIFALIFLFTGSVLINFHMKKIKQTGYIIIEENITNVLVDELKIEIKNKEYNVRFSNDGYEGQSNYKPFMTLGAFTTKSGINSICFYNEKKSFKYEILIKSKIEYDNLKTILKKIFAQ